MLLAVLDALVTLIAHGDYTAPLNLIGWPEDHPAIDLILTITNR